MLSDSDIAVLCADIYSQPSTFDKIISAFDVFMGLKEYEDCIAIIGRGSVTLLDWIRDIEAISPVATSALGIVPGGFYTGIPASLYALSGLTKKPIIMGGHSLGAAHIAQLGGTMISMGMHIEKTVLLGCPTPGGEKLKYLWSGSTITSYKNLADPVTDLPKLPIFCPLRDFTPIAVQPAQPDPYGIFADHHVQLYCAGIANLGKKS